MNALQQNLKKKSLKKIATSHTVNYEARVLLKPRHSHTYNVPGTGTSQSVPVHETHTVYIANSAYVIQL